MPRSGHGRQECRVPQIPSSTTQRLEAFSDGVIAIAITLLVLNIKVPDAGRDAPRLARRPVAVLCRLRAVVRGDRHHVGQPPLDVRAHRRGRSRAAVREPGPAPRHRVLAVPDVAAGEVRPERRQRRAHRRSGLQRHDGADRRRVRRAVAASDPSSQLAGQGDRAVVAAPVAEAVAGEPGRLRPLDRAGVHQRGGVLRRVRPRRHLLRVGSIVPDPALGLASRRTSRRQGRVCAARVKPEAQLRSRPEE